MTKKNKSSKKLVIDASVAKACGGQNATFPTSVNCRDFLQSVLNICHKCVMTPEIAKEWNNHQSKFARTWRAAMMSRKKIICLSANEPSLWKLIEQTANHPNQKQAMEKDFHLLEAALATDHTVISLDDKVNKLFAVAAQTISNISQISWINPDKEPQTQIEWLKQGAKPEKNRKLLNKTD